MTDSKDKSRKINVDGEEATQKAAENKPETEATASKENTDAKTEETPEADPLEEAQKQIEELKDKYLRTVAEFDNYKIGRASCRERV